MFSLCQTGVRYHVFGKILISNSQLLLQEEVIRNNSKSKGNLNVLVVQKYFDCSKYIVISNVKFYNGGLI